MPIPRFPPITTLFTTLIGEAFNIAIVSFALNVSLVKYFSNKHEYQIDSNQELLSYGVGNLMCSLFSGFPACSGLTRSLIDEGIGARTQVYSLISSLVVLTAFLGIGFLFKELPNAVLAAIIFVSLIKKCFETKEFIKIFKTSKLESLAWCITFLGVIILDIDYGLYIGLACSLFLNIIQTQRPYACVLGVIKNTDLYEDVRFCPDVVELKGIKIIRYEANVYYANVDNFKYRVCKLSLVEPKEVIALMDKKKERHAKLLARIAKKKLKKLKSKSNVHFESVSQMPGEQLATDEEDQAKKSIEIELYNILSKIKIKDVVLDMSCINYVDSMGAESILQVGFGFLLLENFEF